MRMFIPYKLNPALHIIITTGLCAALLGGCGSRGSLKPAPPLFGSVDAKTPADTPKSTDSKRRDSILDEAGEPLLLDDETETTVETPEG